MTIPWVLIIIIALAAIVGLFALLSLGKPKSHGKYQEGHFVGIGIAIGVAIGLLVESLALGVGIGAGIGIVMEAKAKKAGKIRPVLKEERKRQLWALIGGLSVLLLLVILFLIARG